jgi:hypothetical protein
MIHCMATDPRWKLLEHARPRLLNRFRDAGVVRIEYVAAFPQLGLSAVWLCTATDEQREAVKTDVSTDEVERLLLEVGFQSADMNGIKLASQSQETVDREYQGSWFYALR